jgi:hypothetical protein
MRLKLFSANKFLNTNTHTVSKNNLKKKLREKKILFLLVKKNMVNGVFCLPHPSNPFSKGEGKYCISERKRRKNQRFIFSVSAGAVSFSTSM